MSSTFLIDAIAFAIRAAPVILNQPAALLAIRLRIMRIMRIYPYSRATLRKMVFYNKSRVRGTSIRFSNIKSINAWNKSRFALNISRDLLSSRLS